MIILLPFQIFKNHLTDRLRHSSEKYKDVKFEVGHRSKVKAKTNQLYCPVTIFSLQIIKKKISVGKS